MYNFLFISGYILISFTFAIFVARHWYRWQQEERAKGFTCSGDISPKGMFLLSFFFFPIAAIFFAAGGVVSVLAAVIENLRLGEKLDKLIEWKNND